MVACNSRPTYWNLHLISLPAGNPTEAVQQPAQIISQPGPESAHHPTAQTTVRVEMGEKGEKGREKV